MDHEALWSLLSEKPEILKDPDWEETLAKHLPVLERYVDDTSKDPENRVLAWIIYALHVEYKKIKLIKQAMRRALAELRSIREVQGLPLVGAYRHVTAQSGWVISEDPSLTGDALRRRILQENAEHLRANDEMANKEIVYSCFEDDDEDDGIDGQIYRPIPYSRGRVKRKRVLPFSARLYYLNMIKDQLKPKLWAAVMKKAMGVGLGDKKKDAKGLVLTGPERQQVHRAKRIYEQVYQKRGFQERMIPWDEIFLSGSRKDRHKVMDMGHCRFMTKTQVEYWVMSRGAYVPPQGFPEVEEVPRVSEEVLTWPPEGRKVPVRRAM